MSNGTAIFGRAESPSLHSHLLLTKNLTPQKIHSRRDRKTADAKDKIHQRKGSLDSI